MSDGALLTPKPLEQLSLPSDLDGGQGTNRALAQTTIKLSPFPN